MDLFKLSITSLPKCFKSTLIIFPILLLIQTLVIITNSIKGLKSKNV